MNAIDPNRPHGCEAGAISTDFRNSKRNSMLHYWDIDRANKAKCVNTKRKNKKTSAEVAQRFRF